MCYRQEIDEFKADVARIREYFLRGDTKHGREAEKYYNERFYHAPNRAWAAHSDILRREVHERGSSVTFLDTGETIGPFEDLFPPSYQGGKLWIVAFHEGHYYTWVEGKLYGPCDGSRHPGLHVSEGQYAVTFRKDGMDYISWQGGLLGPYIDVGIVAVQSERLIFQAQEVGKVWVVVGDEKYGPYDTTSPTSWGPSRFLFCGSRFAWTAQRDGEWVVMCDGVEKKIESPHEGKLDPIRYFQLTHDAFIYSVYPMLYCNDEVHGPFGHIFHTSDGGIHVENGKPTFTFLRQGCKYESKSGHGIVFRGVTHSSFDRAEYSFLGDNLYWCYSRGGEWFVVIEGDTYGPFESFGTQGHDWLCASRPTQYAHLPLGYRSQRYQVLMSSKSWPLWELRFQKF